ncbi:RsmF rRNA methyltransferase first C-terminal domain-containing protein [Blautia sp. 1033sp1_1033st1_G9_1033SCRN_220408]|uniref:RsmF rRNA methyltransferase first C-terminal domain-containing protein n=1 Tax=Blautia sp. 1033sp1_1033st1_G9_1033SCRN_220408 TaxID=3144490 RepID=UPI0034A246FC
MNDDPKYLPEEFLTRMNNMLGDDFQAFLNSYQQPRTFGLRVNTAKISCEEFEKIVPFPISPIPWIPGGYFYPENVRPSKCAFYQAGLYYLQEPSAMTPVSRLLPKPGEYILDMCAAPGGKATALGAALKGHGLLVANDISTSRARALLRNIELFGIPNSFVTSTAPKDLVPCFPEFFHKIILDAPCSGEGMFRKDEALAKDWSPAKSQELSLIQRELILQAADMLRPGGYLLYSTCTFAPQEDEGTVSYLLENRPDMELVEMPGYEGFSDGVPAWGKGQPQLTRSVRIFPHKMNGEGHFMALLHKPGQTISEISPVFTKPNRTAFEYIDAFFREIGLKSLGGQPFDWNRVEIKGDKVYYLPPVSCSIRRINFLRNGLYMGDLKKNRFEPSQPLALALHKGEVSSVITLPVQDQRLERYLKGETLLINPEEAASPKGWQLLCVEGYPLGFGKLVGQTLKNKYPSGWRL